jgi:DNA processing protein
MKELYWLALNMIPGVGDKTAHQLLEIFPSPEALFSETKKGLESIFGNKTKSIDAILSKSMFADAEKELKFIDSNNIQLLTYDSDSFPKRLKRSECNDTPTVLYYKGTANLNSAKVVSMVGTRNATEYGKYVTEKLIKEMSSENILIVSGLAYGIDTYSHINALQNNLPTVAVLGHGLDCIYPTQNAALAKDMIGNGGLLTEYKSFTKIDASNFPARNRIVAALSDAVIVVEAAKKGGALITAEIANSYNRDVFAIPGKINDKYSEGCNNLIKNNKATIIHSADDLFYMMRWAKNKHQECKQAQLFLELQPHEKIVYDLLLENQEMTIDDFSAKCELSLPKIASALLSLELQNVIKCLPGKIYKIM